MAKSGTHDLDVSAILQGTAACLARASESLGAGTCQPVTTQSRSGREAQPCLQLPRARPKKDLRGHQSLRPGAKDSCQTAIHNSTMDQTATPIARRARNASNFPERAPRRWGVGAATRLRQGRDWALGASQIAYGTPRAPLFGLQSHGCSRTLSREPITRILHLAARHGSSRSWQDAIL